MNPNSLLRKEEIIMKTFRGIIAILCTIFTVVLAIYAYLYDIHAGATFGSALLSGALSGLMMGGLLPGLMHLGSIAPKTWGVVKYFPFPFNFVLILPAILVVTAFGGWLFMFADLFGFFAKDSE